MLIYVVMVLISLLLAFLCGSIPVALAIGKSIRGVDVREHGSGNAGSTNAIRVLGLGLGLVVFALDVLKGVLGCIIVKITAYLAVAIASTAAISEEILHGSDSLTTDPIISIFAGGQVDMLYQIPLALAIIAAVLGHMLSPFMGFKGGKGVATALGCVAVVLPFTAVCSFAVFIVIVLITLYVSLGSIIAVATVPVFTAIFYLSPTYIVFTILMALAVIWAHRKNIGRLLKKEEPKFTIPKKDKK